MACARITIVRPLPGRRDEAWEALTRIDETLVGHPGLLMSLTLGNGSTGDQPTLGRISIWESVEEANYSATSEHLLALRARLQRLCADEPTEALLDVDAVHWSPALNLRDLPLAG